MGDHRVVSVDWDSRELRIVHARVRRDRVRVEDVFSVAIPADTDVSDAEQLGRLLRQSLAQERISTRQAMVDIPRDQVVLTTLSLPDVSVSDMAGMVRLQVGKGLPFPISEAVVDFAVPSDAVKDGQREVLVGAVRSEVLAFYQQVCSAAGLKLERVGLRPYANMVAVSSFLSGQVPERVLVVDVGPGLTEIDVLREGHLVFSRAASVYVPEDATRPVPMTAPDASPLEEDEADTAVSIVPFDAEQDSAPRDMTGVVTDLMVEVTRSIEAYRGTDPGAEMDCAVVAGGTGMEETLAEAIQRRFGVHTEAYNPSALLDNDRERGAAASGFSAALGLVLGQAADGALHFDFLNPKKQIDATQARLKKAPLVAAVAALFVIAAGVTYSQGPAKKYAKVRRLQKQIDEARAEIKDNKPFMGMVEAAERWEQDQVVWVDELRHLVSVLPDSKQVVLDKLDLRQRDKTIRLDLRAKDSRQGGEIVQQLEAFRPDGEEGDEPYFKAKRGPTSVAAKGDYPHTGSITVQIVDSGQDGKKKRSGRGR